MRKILLLTVVLVLESVIIPAPLYAAPSATLTLQVIPANGPPSPQSCSANGTAAPQMQSMQAKYPNGAGIGDGNATLNWNDCWQVLDGFGADLPPSTATGLTATSPAWDLLYTLNSSSSIGLTKARGVCEDHFTAVSSCQTIAAADCVAWQAVSQRGVDFYGTFSGPPPSLMTSLGGGNYSFSPSSYQAYADFQVAWLQAVSSQCGVRVPSRLSVMNEPDGIGLYVDWTEGFPTGIDHYIPILAADLSSHGLSTSIAAPEQATPDVSYAGTCVGDPACLAHLGTFFAHGYADGIGDPANPTGPYAYQSTGRHYWQTEWSTSGKPADWTCGLNAASLIFKEFTIENANSFEVQYGASPNSSYDGEGFLVDSNGQPEGGCFYAYGQYSRFVRPGWHLYGATPYAYNSGNVQLTFWRDSASNNFAVVVVNTDYSSHPINFAFNGFTATSVVPVVSNGAVYFQQQPAVTAGSGFSYTIPAQGVVTFIGTAN